MRGFGKWLRFCEKRFIVFLGEIQGDEAGDKRQSTAEVYAA
jgi:hypothetical protein